MSLTSASSGKPTLRKDGYAEYRQTFDARGNRIELSYFDAQGKPKLPKDGCASETQTLDSRGNDMEATCLGLDGKPTLYEGGYARRTRSHDAYGNIYELAFGDVASYVEYLPESDILEF